jgi:rubredoxin
MTLPRWQCLECGYHYDPVKGDPKGGIPPGIPFEDLPDSWRCPECGGIEGKARRFYQAIVGIKELRYFLKFLIRIAADFANAEKEYQY